MNKTEEEESLSRSIRKATDNIEILMNGGMLNNLSTKYQNEMVFDTISLIDENGDSLEFDLETFAQMEEVVIPKTDREIALELEIAGLKDQLTQATTESTTVLGSTIRPRKTPVTLSESQEKIVVQYYLDHKESGIKMKEIADKYNISGNKVSDILEKHGVRIPGRRQRKITYAE